mmetsp:Transcript_27452/g.38187  ORF Transcript_27452/g.38187 Transcript_27452/m.38187 type:complete len:125 (+) Transcript_27452:23-397(+)
MACRLALNGMRRGIVTSSFRPNLVHGSQLRALQSSMTVGGITFQSKTSSSITSQSLSTSTTFSQKFTTSAPSYSSFQTTTSPLLAIATSTPLTTGASGSGSEVLNAGEDDEAAGMTATARRKTR